MLKTVHTSGTMESGNSQHTITATQKERSGKCLLDKQATLPMKAINQPASTNTHTALRMFVTISYMSLASMFYMGKKNALR